MGPGRRPAGRRSRTSIAAFLTRKAWDRFRLDEGGLRAARRQGEGSGEGQGQRTEKESKDDAKDKGKSEASSCAEPVTLELDGIEDRIVRLSMHSADLADADLTPDGETLVYLAKFEKGYDLWKYAPRKKEIKLLAKLDAERAALASRSGGQEGDREARGRAR